MMSFVVLMARRLVRRSMSLSLANQAGKDLLDQRIELIRQVILFRGGLRDAAGAQDGQVLLLFFDFLFRGDDHRLVASALLDLRRDLRLLQFLALQVVASI